MEIYLPIADLPVNVFLILGMGLAVGFISGMFGIGGGFLMTPLLIFVGISPAVSVATVASHIAASSFSGALSYWRRRALDLALALVLLIGGVVGTVLGVWLFTVLRRIGQLDITIGLSYVLLLGTVGGLMVWESVRAILRARSGQRAPLRRPGSHTWVHGLPLKLRFKQSRLLHLGDTGVRHRTYHRLCRRHHGHRRRISAGAHADLRAACADQRRDRHLNGPDAGDDGGRDRVARRDQSPGRCRAGDAADGRRGDRRTVRRARGSETGCRTGCALLLGLLVVAVGLRFAFDLVWTPADLYSIRQMEGGR